MPLMDLSLKGWRKNVPPDPHPVCPEETAYLLAYDMSQNGQLNISTGILLALDCYLRNGDLCALTIKDVIILDDIHCLYAAAVSLRKTKTGRLQSASVRPQFLGQLLIRFLKRWQEVDVENAKLMPVNANTIRNQIRKSVTRLRLKHKITPHSLRYGGATTDTLNGRLTPDAIMYRGRWRSKKTMGNYVRSSEYIHNLATVTESQSKLAKRVIRYPERYFNVPIKAVPLVGTNSPSTVADRTGTALPDSEALIASGYTLMLGEE